MPKYKVSLKAVEFLCFDIEAENESEALDEAYYRADLMHDWDGYEEEAVELEEEEDE